MRGFTDRDGRTWDVVIGRESFGALFAMFIPGRGNEREARQTPLASDSRAGADTELDALSEGELNDLLERSEPKRLG